MSLRLSRTFETYASKVLDNLKDMFLGITCMNFITIYIAGSNVFVYVSFYF